MRELIRGDSEIAKGSRVGAGGGLGDVVFGSSRELEPRGEAVEILLSKYGCMA
jgi:glycogen synthase